MMVSKRKALSKKEDLIEKITILDNQLKRALADYDNLCKRIESDRRDFEERSLLRIVDKLLDVYNDFVRAKEHFKDQGLSMTVNQFWTILESEGVKEIEALGKEFDPLTMDCVEVVEGKKNIVTAVVSPGYWLKNRVIRPAKVKVGKG